MNIDFKALYVGGAMITILSCLICMFHHRSGSVMVRRWYDTYMLFTGMFLLVLLSRWQYFCWLPDWVPTALSLASLGCSLAPLIYIWLWRRAKATITH